MAFPARFPGKCAYADCPQGGTINRGDMITWSRKAKGIAYHDVCFELKTGVKAASSDETTDETPEEHETPKAHAKPAPASDNGLASMLASAISQYLPPAEAILDESRVIELVKQHSSPIQVVSVTVNDASTGESKDKDMGIQHKSFPLMLKVLSARQSSGFRLNVWLVGEAGSGKTTAAHACANALGLPFYFTGSLDNQYGLLGFIDANGKCIHTPFREAYEHGGVFLFDEVDASSPNAVLAFNAALANGSCAFPDGLISRHPDFACIAAANTWGLGATNDYVGRFKMDAAFNDRFVQLAWSIDEDLESATCGNAEWSKRVQAIRARVKALGIKVVVSPRASYFGAALLAAGLPQDDVERMTLRKAMTDDQWSSVSGKGAKANA
jgi:hypothetical protein